EKAEAWAREQGAAEILILSNTVLAPAIALYKKHGYATTHLGPHPDYERCNIEMRKFLEPQRPGASETADDTRAISCNSKSIWIGLLINPWARATFPPTIKSFPADIKIT